jgi:hypothetical protein
MQDQTDDGRDVEEYLFEIREVGNIMRVTVIDPYTGIEIVVVGSPQMSLYSLKMNAIRKLKYVIAKREKEYKDTHSNWA